MNGVRWTYVGGRETVRYHQMLLTIITHDYQDRDGEVFPFALVLKPSSRLDVYIKFQLGNIHRLMIISGFATRTQFGDTGSSDH